MRKMAFGRPINGQEIPWLVNAVRKIELASYEDIEAVFDAVTISGAYTETRTLTPSTATASDIANLLATLITDIKKRGASRTQ
jgi:hypothetical protein